MKHRQPGEAAVLSKSRGGKENLSDHADYNAPPVVEVVVSVAFESMQSQHSAPLALFGAFWREIKDDYPRVAAQSPVVDKRNAGSHWGPARLELSLSNVPDARLQLYSSDDAFVCQLQHDRLIFNWRKVTEDSPYVRFEVVKGRFLDLWNHWNKFLGTFGLETKTTHWEVKYLNALDTGDDWSSLGKLAEMLPGLAPEKSIPGLKMEVHRSETKWRAEDTGAHLDITINPSLGPKRQKVIILELTASRKCDTLAIEDDLEIGHKLINDTFESVFSDDAKSSWE